MSKKSLLAIAALTLVVLPVLVLSVISVLPTRWLAEKIEQSLFQRWGVEVSVDTLDLDLLRFLPQVTGNSVALRFPDSGTLLSGLEFKAAYTLPELLKGNGAPVSLAIAASEGTFSIPGAGEDQALELPWLLDATIQSNGPAHQIALKNFTLDGSEIRGSLEVDLSSSIAVVVGELASDHLDLDTLSQVRTALKLSSGNSQDQYASAGHYFSPDPLDLDLLVKHASGAVRYDITSAKYRNLTMNALTMTLSADGESSVLTVDSNDFIEGNLSVKIVLSLASDLPRLQVESEIKLLSIGELFSVLGDENTVAGTVSGKGKYWFNGRSVASLAAGANGGLFLLVDRGELDAMFIELAGLDVSESLSLLFRKSIRSATVNCGYIDIKSRNGLSTLTDFVFDTEDTVFTGSGTVNFNSQKIDVTIKPLPRDAGFLAAPTALKIGGTLAQPTIRPARTLLTRLATAAALATFASPAAALVPFIEIGNDHSGEGCAGYVKAVK